MEKILVSFKIKEALTPEVRKKIEDLLSQKIKGSISKEKTKEKKGRWTIKLKNADLLTLSAFEEIIKKAGAKKMLRDITIGDGSSDEEEDD